MDEIMVGDLGSVSPKLLGYVFKTISVGFCPRDSGAKGTLMKDVLEGSCLIEWRPATSRGKE